MDEKCQKYHDKMKKPEVIESVKPKKDKDKDKDKDKEKDKKGDKFTRDNLENENKGNLKKIVQKITNREKNSYNYGDIKNMTKKELVNIALVCQGKKKGQNKDYNYKSESDINKMNEKELRDTLNDMLNREPGTYKYSESSWSKPTLVDFILTCQGSSTPRNLRAISFVGGGWII